MIIQTLLLRINVVKKYVQPTLRMKLIFIFFLFVRPLTLLASQTDCALILASTAHVKPLPGERFPSVFQSPVLRKSPKSIDFEPARTEGWLEVIQTGQFSIFTKGLPKIQPSQIGFTGSVEIPPMNEDQQLFRAVTRVIEVSNRAMETRRGWSSDFMADRFRIAREYSGRSFYYIPDIPYSREMHGDGEGRSLLAQDGGWSPTIGDFLIYGTIGLTIARTESGLKIQDLPLENLKDDRDGYQWNIQYNGRRPGVLFEARSYSMKEGMQRFVFPRLLSPMSNRISEELASEPALWDEEIIYSYADDKSLRLYPSQWGFKVLDSSDGFRPIQRGKIWNKEARNWEPLVWRAIRISPRKWFENRVRFKGHYQIESEPTNPRLLPEFGQLILNTKSNGPLLVRYVGMSPDGQLHSARFVKRTEIVQGIWARDILWGTDGGIRLDRISGSPTELTDIQLTPEIRLQADSSFELWGNNRVRMITISSPAYLVKPAEYVAAGDTIFFTEEGDPQLTINSYISAPK